MANETVAEAQSLPSDAPAGELSFTPESQQAPLTVPLADQFNNLSADQLQSVIDKLGGDTGRELSGPGAPVQPLRDPATTAEAAPPAPVEAAAEVPVEQPPADPPPVELQENPPGRIRIDKITDERTRQILEFQSRNHDATIEDAIAFVDGQRQAAAPAPQTAPAGPDIAGIQTRIADLNRQIKAGLDPMSPGHDAAAIEDLREQRENLRVDLRFAQEQANRQQANFFQQRTDVRAASVDRATAICPEVNDPNTPQGQLFARIAKDYQNRNDPILQNDDVPMLIALQVMHATGYAPKAAAPAPAPVAPPAPARPAAPAVRTTVPVGGAPQAAAPATAPGNARLTPVATPSPAQLADALSTMDSGLLEQVIEKAGQKLAPPVQPYSRA